MRWKAVPPPEAGMTARGFVVSLVRRGDREQDTKSSSHMLHFDSPTCTRLTHHNVRPVARFTQKTRGTSFISRKARAQNFGEQVTNEVFPLDFNMLDDSLLDLCIPMQCRLRNIHRTVTQTKLCIWRLPWPKTLKKTPKDSPSPQRKHPLQGQAPVVLCN